MKSYLVLVLLLTTFSLSSAAFSDAVACVSEGVKFGNSLLPQLNKLNNLTLAEILKETNNTIAMDRFFNICGIPKINLTLTLNSIDFLVRDRDLDKFEAKQQRIQKKIEEQQQEEEQIIEELEREEEQIKQQIKKEKEEKEREQEDKDLEVSGFKEQFIACAKKAYEVSFKLLPQLQKLKLNMTLYQILHNSDNDPIMDELRAACTFKNMSKQNHQSFDEQVATITQKKSNEKIKYQVLKYILHQNMGNEQTEQENNNNSESTQNEDNNQGQEESNQQSENDNQDNNQGQDESNQQSENDNQDNNQGQDESNQQSENDNSDNNQGQDESNQQSENDQSNDSQENDNTNNGQENNSQERQQEEEEREREYEQREQEREREQEERDQERQREYEERENYHYRNYRNNRNNQNNRYIRDKQVNRVNQNNKDKAPQRLKEKFFDIFINKKQIKEESQRELEQEIDELKREIEQRREEKIRTIESTVVRPRDRAHEMEARRREQEHIKEDQQREIESEKDEELYEKEKELERIIKQYKINQRLEELKNKNKKFLPPRQIDLLQSNKNGQNQFFQYPDQEY